VSVAHAGDVERRALGDGAWERDLGAAAGAVAVGLRLVDVRPGARAELPGTGEAIVHVRSGSGRASADGDAHLLGAGDTVVRHAGAPPLRLEAGDGGLEALVFAEHGEPPREAPATALGFVRLDDAPLDEDERGEFAWRERNVARGAGSVRAGLRHAWLPPARMSTPPHWHSHEHELFHVLDGGGALLLFDNDAKLVEQRLLRPGHLVSRPANSLVAHTLRAGEDGMTVLAYGTRRQDEIVFYPRSRKRRLGRDLQRLVAAEDPWEGEV
jgi:uncharacterized cupin superfamily protein